MITHGKSIKIFTGNSNPELAKSICQELEAKKIKAQYIDLTYEKPYIKL